MYKLSMIILIFSHASFASESNIFHNSVVDSMQNIVNSLGENNNFGFIDIRLSDKEKLACEQLQIKNFGSYNCYGNLDFLNEELPLFFKKIGVDNIEIIKTVTAIIYRISHYVIKALNKETAWVSVRSFLKFDEYDIPRWHRDGSYYQPFGEASIKFATVLKGNQTLFYSISTALRKEFLKIEQNRNELVELINRKESISGKFGEGAFFIVGDPDIAAIHSEPIIDSERLFFSIVAGSKKEIEEIHINHTL